MTIHVQPPRIDRTTTRMVALREKMVAAYVRVEQTGDLHNDAEVRLIDAIAAFDRDNVEPVCPERPQAYWEDLAARTIAQLQGGDPAWMAKRKAENDVWNQEVRAPFRKLHWQWQRTRDRALFDCRRAELLAEKEFHRAIRAAERAAEAVAAVRCNTLDQLRLKASIIKDARDGDGDHIARSILDDLAAMGGIEITPAGIRAADSLLSITAIAA